MLYRLFDRTQIKLKDGMKVATANGVSAAMGTCAVYTASFLMLTCVL